MNIRALQLLRRIVAVGSLNEASEAMNLSVSAASRMLSQFEDDIGLTLFSRERRKLELTEEGQQFYAQIETTLVALDEIRGIAHDIRRSTRASFCVVTAAPLANGMAVPALARMRARDLGFDCNVTITNRFEIESKVAARGDSIGLISLPVENQIISLDAVPFLQAQTGVLMPQGHRLCDCAEVSATDLGEEAMISLAPKQRWRARYDQIMQGMHRPASPQIETGSTMVSVEMVRAGLGLTLIDRVCAPRSMVGLVLRPLAGDHWNTYASLHPQGKRAPLAEAFLDAITAHIEDLVQCDDQAAAMLRLI